MKNRFFLYIPLLITVSFLLSACDAVILQPQGLIATIEKNILIVSTLLMLLVVIPVIILTLTFAWRYRETNTKAVYAPNWAHNTWLEVIWWSVPCLIIVILGAITYVSSHTLDPYRPIASDKSPVRIQAIALQWKWLFIYPAQGIASVNYVQFPANVPIEFSISSEGPMNSFHIPALGSQIYSMAGMQTKLNLIADKTGNYRGLSAHFSGDGFSDMKFIAHASTQEEFTRWVKQVKQSQQNLSLLTYNKLAQPSTVPQPLFYASVSKNIFDMVVMKAMMPISLEDMAKCDEQTLIAMRNRNYQGIGYAQ